MSNNTMKQNTLEMKGGKTVYLQYKEWWNAKINAIELEKVTQITNKINDLTKDEPPDNKIREKLKKELKDRKEEWKTDVKANTEFNKIFAFGINFGITSLGKTKKQKFWRAIWERILLPRLPSRCLDLCLFVGIYAELFFFGHLLVRYFSYYHNIGIVCDLCLKNSFHASFPRLQFFVQDC